MQVGGPSWTVEYGRRDGVTANITLANEDLPSALNSGPQLQSIFESKGFNLQQMVALSGKTSELMPKRKKKVFSPI
jgi:peroxidase